MNHRKSYLLKSRESRRFLRHLAQYLCLAVLILASTIPVYAVALETNRQNEINNATAMFHSAFNEMNTLLDSLVFESNKLFEDSDIILLTSHKGEWLAQDYIRLWDASALLSKSIRGKPLLRDVYILSNSNSVFLSNQMVSDDSATIYGYFYEVDDADIDTWNGLIRSGTTKYYLLPSMSCKPFVSVDSTARTETLHFVVRSTAITENANSIFAVYTLNTDAIIDRFVNIYLKDYAYLSITDTDGNKLVQYGPAENTDNANYEKIQGDSSNLHVELGIEKTYFRDRVANIRTLLLLYAGLLVGIAVVLAVLLTFRQMKPLRYLMDSLRPLSPDDPAVYTGSDYQYISDTVVHLDTQRRQYEQEVDAMRNSIRNNLVHNIFQGGIYTQEDEDLCRQVLKLDGKFFCAMLMSPQEAVSIPQAGKINTVCAEYISQFTGVQVLTYNQNPSTTYFLISFLEAERARMEPLQELLESVHAEILTEYGKHCSFSIGTMTEEIKSISVSTANAKNIISLCTSATPVRRCMPNNFSAKQALFLPNQSTRKLKTLLISSLSKEIDAFVAKLGEDYSAQAEENTEIGANVYFTLRNAIMEVCGQYSPEILQESKEMHYSGHFSQDLDLLRGFSLKIAEEIQKKREMESASLGKKVAEFIVKNYSNPNLYAAMIADQFSISEKYVFSLVKAETGKSLGEYIEQVRFQRVEELLAEKESINSIALQVGFNSVNTFYKAFKRIYGTSPAKWRDTHLR